MTRRFAFLLPLVAAAVVTLWPVRAGAQATQPLGGVSKVPPGEYVIGGVTVRGAQFTDQQTVLLLSGLSVGKKISIPGPDVPKAITKLWKQDIFSDVQIEVSNIEGEQIFFVIVLTERPRISRYSFRGVSKGQADDLREKIKLVRGTIFTESKSRTAVRVIKNFYQEKGYLNTTVNIDTRLDTADRKNNVAITMRVNKGPRVKVRRIILEGNEQMSSYKLRKRFKETKQAFPMRFWKRSKLVRAKFNEDKENLMKFFSAQGYRDAQILSDTFYQVSRKRVELKVKLIEGPRYYFRSISFLGNNKYDANTLNRVLKIKKGDVYDRELLEKRLSQDPTGVDLSSLYLDDGYLFFRAEPVEVAVVNDSIDLEVRMVEGPQAIINRILIEGNESTSDHVVLREIRTLPGEKFSRSEIIRSQREILNLGFFDQQKMNIVPQPDPARGTVDIKYVLAERSNDQITLQGGWSGQVRDRFGNVVGGGLLATVGLQFNNFSTRRFFDKRAWRPLPKGDGQRLSLQVQTNGVNFQNYGISFMEPWFGGKRPNSFGINMNYSIQSQPTINYRLGIFNTSLDLGRRLTWPDDFFRSFTSIRYAHYQLSNTQNIFGPTTGNGEINIIALRQTFDRTSIDAPIFSRSGSVFNLFLEATPPWSLMSRRNVRNETPIERYKLLEFYKIKFNTEIYLTLTQSKKLPMVLFARARGGFLGGYNAAYGISPFERFYLGGDGLQGFNLDGREILAMRGYRLPQIGDPLSQGSVAFVKYTMELRQPLTLEQSAMVWVHAYVEAGNAFTEIERFNPFELKRSFGFGLRAFLPMFGLLGLDWGYGVDRTITGRGDDISGTQFHFMIGQQF
jgi:outer membrane protein insertion porin family